MKSKVSQMTSLLVHELQCAGLLTYTPALYFCKVLCLVATAAAQQAVVEREMHAGNAPNPELIVVCRHTTIRSLQIAGLKHQKPHHALVTAAAPLCFTIQISLWRPVDRQHKQ